MSGRVPTAEQQRAIEAGAGEILVEAGAGTGKTGVMVDRYCRLVCEQGVPPDSILAFTFTEKAAAELRQRIRADLARRAEQGSERAAELHSSFGGAWVTTIHGFCNRLLTAHPVAVGVDPRFRVLDAAETERTAREAFDEALAAFLAGGDRDREETLAAYDVGGLRGMVVAAHAELRSRGAADPELPPRPEVDVEAALRRAHAAAADAIGELKPGSANHQLLERALSALADPAAPIGLDEIVALRCPRTAKPMAAYREAAEAAIAAVAGETEGGRAYEHVRELLGVFSERFAAVKRRRAGVDFEDLQIFAAQLLERSETGAAYRDRFAHILVDEFQDTNRLQLRLIEALRGPATRLMVVGDELQSIYGFRHADLEVFRERRAAIDASADGKAISLSGNFRSRPEVIGAVNALGAELLGDDFRPLRVGAEPSRPQPPGGGPAVELLLTGRDDWDAEDIDLQPATDARTPDNQLAEARFLAARLRGLADEGVDRGGMVVLLRAFTRLDAHEDSLERAGLRPYVVGGRGYWSQQQVADVCALLATVANPLDDKALFGSLASPACGAAPDTLWLLRAAAGPRRPIWETLLLAAGLGEDARADRRPLESIPEAERGLLREFADCILKLRRRAAGISLPGLIDAIVTETGYDLAVLMRHSGEARFANVRKLMRLAADFESAEGRDLRGLLDFLAARADADADAQAATAVEGHDGVRIMTIHSAKGLEFDVVAIPHLSRRLLRQGQAPLLTIGHEAERPRVGMQLRRLGARGINVFAQRALCEEDQAREAQEELRLFHVGATRARGRLLLSGVINPEPAKQESHGAPIAERIVAAFGIDREGDSTVPVAPPQARADLDAAFPASEIAVRVNLASAERAAELSSIRRDEPTAATVGEGPAPLLDRRPPRRPNRPLSYTAIAAHGADPEEPLLEGAAVLAGEASGDRGPAGLGDGAARGRAVHALLEWSHANGWRSPPPELLERLGRSAAEAGGDPVPEDVITGPFRGWLSSRLFEERIRDARRSRSEVPLLVEVADTVLRGAIDLLVEEDDAPPLIVDYKTDRLDGADPAALAGRYEIQQAIYALAVAEARGTEEVDLAYVFLERPEDPVLARWGAEEIAAGRRMLEERIARIREG
jgi:ATP-dependent exoDNAse (exonuclease V) beta subunit